MKGFTLIELMIVVAIIGILAAIGIPAYKQYQCQKGSLEYCEDSSKIVVKKKPKIRYQYKEVNDPEERYLDDGTKCVFYKGTMTCNWER